MRALAVTLTVLLLGTAAGCSFTSAVAYQPPGAARDPAQVRVLAGSDPGRPYQVVGLVVAQLDTDDPAEQLAEVRRLAAGLGADAVVDLRLRLGFGVFSVGHHLSGTAVRYR